MWASGSTRKRDGWDATFRVATLSSIRAGVPTSRPQHSSGALRRACAMIASSAAVETTIDAVIVAAPRDP
jgi:hypothetical protein